MPDLMKVAQPQARLARQAPSQKGVHEWWMRQMERSDSDSMQEMIIDID